MISNLTTRILNKAYTTVLEFKTDIQLDRGLVSFTFDDFPLSALRAGGQILEEAGWRGTYYCSANLLGTSGAVGQIATDGDLHDCLARGHELANHTLSHLKCPQANRQTIIQDIESNARRLPAGATRNFAYPFGASDTRVRRNIARHIATGRGIDHGINRISVNPKLLRANALYSFRGVDQLLKYTEENMNARGWLIFYTHDVQEAPSEFGCTPRDFQIVANAVRDADLEVVTIEEARARLGF